jgi:hypothetical protein
MLFYTINSLARPSQLFSAQLFSVHNSVVGQFELGRVRRDTRRFDQSAYFFPGLNFRVADNPPAKAIL